MFLDLVSLSLVAALSVFCILMVARAIVRCIRLRKNVTGMSIGLLNLFQPVMRLFGLYKFLLLLLKRTLRLDKLIDWNEKSLLQLIFYLIFIVA